MEALTYKITTVDKVTPGVNTSVLFRSLMLYDRTNHHGSQNWTGSGTKPLSSPEDPANRSVQELVKNQENRSKIGQNL